MARKPRFNLPGVPQHIIQRGNNREPCFYAEEDYQRYLCDLTAASKDNNVAIHAYVLMTNHVHLLATPGEAHGIAHMMQIMGSKYVRYINSAYQRTGTLWEGRYKSGLIDSEAYMLTCMRYIELNPVRAGMVEHPGEYRWSSYARNAQLQSNKLITSHPCYLALGGDDVERQEGYRDLFRHHIDDHLIDEIRGAVNHELVLGRDDFKEKIAAVTQRQVEPAKMGRPRIQEGAAIYYVL